MVDDLAHACPGRSHHGRPARPPRRRWPTSGRRPHYASGAGRPPGPGGPNFNKAGPRAHGLGGSSPPGGTHGSSPPCSWSSRCWPARSRPTHPWTRGLALAAPRGSAAGQERSDFCRCPAVRERSLIAPRRIPLLRERLAARRSPSTRGSSLAARTRSTAGPSWTCSPTPARRSCRCGRPPTWTRPCSATRRSKALALLPHWRTCSQQSTTVQGLRVTVPPV